MPNTCTVCTHPDRSAIDEKLIRQTPQRQIVAEYPPLSKTAIQRHASEHIPASLTKAREVAERVDGDALMGRLEDLQVRTLRILEAAETGGDNRTALSGIREARGNIELQGKILQIISTAPTVNVLSNPMFIQIQDLIVDALEPYPEARAAVLEAVQKQKALTDGGLEARKALPHGA